MVAWRELAASGFYLATSPSSSFVYLLTGMHGIHLLGGVLVLLVRRRRAPLAQVAGISLAVVILDATAWYWHFMTFLWVYILCLLEFAR